jgi:small subunit ribosomal protein S1
MPQQAKSALSQVKNSVPEEEIDQILNDATVEAQDSEDQETREKEAATKNSIEKGKESQSEAEDQSEMARLLQEYPVKLAQEGEKVEGRVVGVESMAVYVDLEKLGAGVVYGKDIKDGFGPERKRLGIGDKLTAVILDLENEDGYVELSISEALREEAWKDLRQKMKDKAVITTKILDANKGGLMVEVNGITGFMPVSQLTSEHYPRVEDGDKQRILEILRGYIGTEMNVCVLDLDEEEEKLIVSEKQANLGKEKEAIAELKVGDVVEGHISGIVDFGAFVKFAPPSKQDVAKEDDKLEGLVHISQLDWQLIEDPRKVVKVGEKVQAKIISIDGTRISLSTRVLKDDPWMTAAKKYNVGDKVTGTVHKINHFGAFVYLDRDIHGLAHVSGFPQYPQRALDEIIETDKEYTWQIMSMEPSEHRMGLKFVGESKEGKKQAEQSSQKEEDFSATQEKQQEQGGKESATAEKTEKVEKETAKK